MFTEIIRPRFLETDALGHINNNSYGVWFEAARDPFFKLFIPDSNIKKWNLVMAHSSLDFLKEVFWGKDVVIKTAVSKIGASSIELVHALYQEGNLCTIGKCVMIHFNFETKESMKIPQDIREKLQLHIFTSPWSDTLEEQESLESLK